MSPNTVPSQEIQYWMFDVRLPWKHLTELNRYFNYIMYSGLTLYILYHRVGDLKIYIFNNMFSGSIVLTLMRKEEKHQRMEAMRAAIHTCSLLAEKAWNEF